MGNSCKKNVRIMKNRSFPKGINNCFYFDDENNNSLNPQKAYIDLCDKKINNYENFERNNESNLYLDKDKKVNRNSSIIYIDELYSILGNEEKIRLKKLDNSDAEEFLIIKKHIKYKKKKKKKNRDCNVYNIDSYSTDKYNMLRNIHSDNNNNNRKNNKLMKNGIKKTKEKCSKDLLYYENDNKKTKKKSNFKLDDIETCCSSSNESKHDKFVKDKKYDIFEEDRIFLLKKRREEMNQKDINSSYINNKKNTYQNNSIYRGDNNDLTILDTFKK
ncbi:conserved Plasmodium protein, unknown function [Plasmodium berghei]|uniref:Uncharacterized protein n=1 Tax=Plasmodium berghei TaxID=5821 RepID=A0A1D3SHQ3_PLABE|nr:conserved Plasmodium protein, unknown function [Plasmodium berghei]